jgi:hypothetical protein
MGLVPEARFLAEAGRYLTKKLSRTDFSGKVASDLGPPRSTRPRPRRKALVGLTVLCGTACRGGEGIPSRGGFPAGRSWVSLSRVLFPRIGRAFHRLPDGMRDQRSPAGAGRSDASPNPAIPADRQCPVGRSLQHPLSPVGHPRCRVVSHRFLPVSRRFRRKPPLLPAASRPLPTAIPDDPFPSRPAFRELICDVGSPQPRSCLRRPGPDTLRLYASSAPPTSRPKFGGLSPRVARCHLR